MCVDQLDRRQPLSEGPARRVLVTGATGYVGGRLVPRLLNEGVAVRCLVRTPAKLDGVAWRESVEVVAGSLADPLEVAMAGVDTAFYLVHGIGAGANWIEHETRDARAFRLAAQAAGVSRIIYLGGMGRDDARLSPHLASRHAVGRELAAGPIPVTELRAAVIIGSGSASFEMLRYLVEVLPIMITPRWVATKSQPIAISDVLDYLVKAMRVNEPLSGVLEIGGPDVVSYAEMMSIYAEEAGLNKRRLLAVPVLTPRLSSHWVGLVTPVPASLARPLVDSLVNEVIVTDPRAARLLGAPKTSLREAIRLALGRTKAGEIPTAFTDADFQPFRSYTTDPSWAGGTELRDERHASTTAPIGDVFAALCILGGETGWHAGEWLWRVRGWLDSLWGGPGMRRGRRDPTTLRVGDFVDFWRVESLEAPHSLRLHAEMVLPGEAWLEWRLEESAAGTLVTQVARFKPRGLWGRVYWLGAMPFHRFVFPGLLRGVIADAEGPARERQ